ncbi:udp-3-o-[3-hydroxymyristoyl] glucosamine n-acyltransferase lpxd [Lucifera butyrica]|uniref:UDP-3-O-acylglucosamine N-acyltransferase n=1 Tax=Lucifera butyrica TaxID=1351585 RepID=A0A498RGQ6_9FIRM|nr:UDP-3-O-(3-hydroxymyristoyl)glucosamine N-acyltransferase [Lucifera butyrica]VBB09262.1 udp-3-o-[3-hydroxymyristoyl] glucosamine n-acyltransferase lpxd [Lucifera butyrica]
MIKKLDELAALVEGVVLGDGDVTVTGVTNIEDAGEQDITFAVPPHLEKAARCRAAAVIIPDSVTEYSKPAIRVANPRIAFTKLLELFTPPLQVERKVHPAAVVAPTAILGQNVAVMPCAVIADHAVIGDNTVIYPHTYIGQEAVIGQDTVLYPSVTVRERCRIGNRNIIHSGAVIGSDGFGFVTIGGEHRKVPQVGNVVIEDDVEIGANVTVDRATTGSTVVKRGTKVDNLVHIAHNVVIGEHCYLTAQTGIAGSTKVGNYVTFAGQSGSNGHITIGDHCVFAAKAGVTGDVPAGSFYAGFPARPHQEWLRAAVGMYKVNDIMKKVRELERRLAELEPK